MMIVIKCPKCGTELAKIDGVTKERAVQMYHSFVCDCGGVVMEAEEYKEEVDEYYKTKANKYRKRKKVKLHLKRDKKISDCF